MLISEKNGSFTVNVNGGKVMSTRSAGMVGKSYKTTQEAFKEPNYYTAIQRPEKSRYGEFYGFLGALFFVATFGYIFWQGLTHFLPS
jgi:hypothetical protein